MNFKTFKEIMSKYHGINRNVDFGDYFNLSPQTISNWKQRNQIPGYISSKLNNQPYVQYNNKMGPDETLRKFIDLFLITSDAIIEIECDKILGTEYGLATGTGLFKTGSLRGWFTHTSGNWKKISGFNNNELIRMSNLFEEFYDVNYPESIARRWKILYSIGTEIIITTRPWMINRKDGSFAIIKAKVITNYKKETFKVVVQDYQIIDSKKDIKNKTKTKLWSESELDNLNICE